MVVSWNVEGNYFEPNGDLSCLKILISKNMFKILDENVILFEIIYRDLKFKGKKNFKI